jgi:hypothetical protein
MLPSNTKVAAGDKNLPKLQRTKQHHSFLLNDTVQYESHGLEVKSNAMHIHVCIKWIHMCSQLLKTDII